MWPRTPPEFSALDWHGEAEKNNESDNGGLMWAPQDLLQASEVLAFGPPPPPYMEVDEEYFYEPGRG